MAEQKLFASTALRLWIGYSAFLKRYKQEVVVANRFRSTESLCYDDRRGRCYCSTVEERCCNTSVAYKVQARGRRGEDDGLSRVSRFSDTPFGSTVSQASATPISDIFPRPNPLESHESGELDSYKGRFLEGY